jgi:hypothetical protein
MIYTSRKQVLACRSLLSVCLSRIRRREEARFAVNKTSTSRESIQITRRASRSTTSNSIADDQGLDESSGKVLSVDETCLQN